MPKPLAGRGGILTGGNRKLVGVANFDLADRKTVFGVMRESRRTEMGNPMER